ncbi:putative NAD(P)H-dependent FMN-containing oxidoreductase YwqN [Moorella thermoacetica]|uniref:Putative NAD(P)H-dependent FMN-containing oxidoreductase YwqN n=1 Tax=Neomoorella thermoacetica TaxID=1525 RepID=A0A1J5NNV7_NEOTH|nr:putative NAD(P)H-dependent FMN-containing oxidoreductase YwqN [Moorella thermoacetica]
MTAINGRSVLVIGIAGSPRRQGNSELLLDTVLEGARVKGATVEKIVLAGFKINPCRGCDYCRSGQCIQRDDMDLLGPRLEQAAALVIASPIFFYGVPAQLKAMIDRSQVYWNRKHRLGKPIDREPGRNLGALIAVGATRGEKLFTGAILTIKYFFNALNLDYTRELLVRGVDASGAIREHPEELAAAFKMGQDLVIPITGL